MLTLNDGRSELWQWDTNRKLTVDADCSQVHFSNKVFGRSIDVDVVGGVAIVPDILLQVDKELTAWAFVGTAENGYTKISKTFKVNRRNKPADYVFTPTDQTTLVEILERIDDLEAIQDPDAIKNAVEEYLEHNPVESPVQSVNGKTGNVKLSAQDVGAISQDDLQEATNKALKQAKESGDFDGAPGPQGEAGPQGPQGIPGNDYILTEADKTEIAEQAAELVYFPESSGGIPIPETAEVGQTIKVSAVDATGKPTEWEAVDFPSGGGYGGGDLDMAGSVIDNVCSLSFSPVDDGYSQAFWIQSANDIKNDDGSHTAVAEFFSSESDGPVVLRNIADGEKDNEAVNLSQLKTRLPAPLTASVGQYIQITAIDENGLVTAVEAVDTPTTPGSSGTSAEKAAELQLAAGVIAAETAANTKINTGVSLAMLKKYRRFVFVLKGATNQSLQNLYLHFGEGRKIGRSDSAGGLVYMYEWVNREESLLKATAVFQGNPSLVRPIGSSYVVNSIPSSWDNGSAGYTGVHIFNLSSAADDVTLILENGKEATIDYGWAIRGLTI